MKLIYYQHLPKISQLNFIIENGVSYINCFENLSNEYNEIINNFNCDKTKLFYNMQKERISVDTIIKIIQGIDYDILIKISNVVAIGMSYTNAIKFIMSHFNKNGELFNKPYIE